jgi:RNA polymerase sigma-70 factor (ECF subfamily)
MKKNNPNLTDNQLVELAKKDPDMFSGLVEKYWSRLFGYVRKTSYFLNEDIEDILQEAFIKVYQNLNAFNDDYKFSTWIYQITRNTVIDAIRKKHVRPYSINLENEEILDFFASSIDMERELLTKSDLKEVKRIISELPEKYREVMTLKFLEEKSYEEIMDIVKKPKGTVASLINRGKKIVKKETLKNNLILK